MQITILDQWYDLHILNGNHKIEFKETKFDISNCFAEFNVYLTIQDCSDRLLCNGIASIKDCEGVEDMNNEERKNELIKALVKSKKACMKFIMRSIKEDGIVDFTSCEAYVSTHPVKYEPIEEVLKRCIQKLPKEKREKLIDELVKEVK